MEWLEQSAPGAKLRGAPRHIFYIQIYFSDFFKNQFVETISSKTKMYRTT
jgi:hypothetical protein